MILARQPVSPSNLECEPPWPFKELLTTIEASMSSPIMVLKGHSVSEKLHLSAAHTRCERLERVFSPHPLDPLPSSPQFKLNGNFGRQNVLPEGILALKPQKNFLQRKDLFLWRVLSPQKSLAKNS